MSLTRSCLVLPLLAAAIATAASCSSCRRELTVSPPVYREAVSAFYTGLAALQTSQDGLALQKLERVTVLVPDEPAPWANLGLLYLRHQALNRAMAQLTRAAALAPASAAIQRLLGLTESRRGNLAAAIRHWQRAVELDSDDLRSAFAIAEEIERQGGAANETESQRRLATLLGRSDNLAVRIESVRLAAKRGEAATLRQLIAPLDNLSASWPSEAREQLQALQTAAATNPGDAALQAVFLKNVLLVVPSYRQALALITTPLDVVGEPLDRFLALRNPEPSPAPADTGLTFSVGLVFEADTFDATWAGVVSLDGEGAPVVIAAGPAGVRVANRQVAPATGSPVRAVLAVDVNADFRADLIVAGARGISILRQEDAGRFTNVTALARLPVTIQSSPVSGIWGADTDLDGDLDLVIAPEDGAPTVLRNNNDGTFSALAQSPFGTGTRMRGFVWADLDGDVAPDAAVLHQDGAVRLFMNMRGGAFKEEPLPAGIEGTVALATAAVGHGPAYNLLLLDAARRVKRIAPVTRHVSEVARIDAPLGPLVAGAARLILADLDNNGAADLVVAAAVKTRALLGGADGRFLPAGEVLDFGAADIGDLDEDGRLDLVGLTSSHRVARVTSRGAEKYHWQVLRLRAATTHGDQRINSFGLGGEAEVRAGLHAQRQVITSPLVHFGLGTATESDVIRITWPNGVLQSEFDQRADTTVRADQRLKGSCPWLFAWSGRAMTFVTDLIWRSPLGLRINAHASADVVMTEDRVRVPGDRLVAREGAYDLRVTAELWETHFFDLVSLLVVDHPAGTEVMVDERFAVPAPSLTAVATGPVQPFHAVRDDRGLDVSSVVRARDDRHLDFAGRGPYQGITRDHYIELELPDESPRTGPLWLVAEGWVHPTDSSLNVAISQGAHAVPRSLSLQVADAAGRFRTVRDNLGFPAGKDKTILLDLAGLFPNTGPRRLRLATNLEIYWDRLGWALGRPDVRLDPRRLTLTSADLRYRGYSATAQRDPSSPERPRYELAGTTPRWFDLEGYYTRFGDVRELVTSVDDRYVIMNAGDELQLRFPEAPPLAPGLVRDFIVVADGWVKDGDYNTSFSRTVLPLPSHGTGRYDTPPGRLQDDPVYRRHRNDFAAYHTRYIAGGRRR